MRMGDGVQTCALPISGVPARSFHGGVFHQNDGGKHQARPAPERDVQRHHEKRPHLSYFLERPTFLKESRQRTFNILSRGRDLGCTLRSIAHSQSNIWNFFGSFFAKKEHRVFQQSFQLSTARIPRGLLKKGVFRVFHRKVHRLFKTIHPRFSAAQSGPAEFSTKLTPPTTTTTIV